MALEIANAIGWSSDWARTRRSPRRARALVCMQIGHSLPERTHAWTRRDRPVESVSCRRCGRVFQAPRICETCGQMTNKEEV